MPPTETEYFSKTLDKALSILSLFEQSQSRRTLTEISKLLGINKTSAYRYVNTLVLLGYLKRGTSTKSLSLGPKALLLGYQFFQGFELLQTVKPLIDKTYTDLLITIDSVLLDHNQLIALYRRESKNTLHFRHPLVSRSLYARATGKAILAQMDSQEVETFLAKSELQAKTSNTITNREDLLKDLELTRQRGYALSNGEYIVGLNAIGAPLLNFHTKRIVGAVSFDLPALEDSIKSIVKKYANALHSLSNSLSEMITATGG